MKYVLRYGFREIFIDVEVEVDVDVNITKRKGYLNIFDFVKDILRHINMIKNIERYLKDFPDYLSTY